MSDATPSNTPTPSTPVDAGTSPALAAPVASRPAGASTVGPRFVTVNGVNWGNVLDFTHLFRGFRLAINPAKLAIALLAIVAIYLSGRLFDLAWGPQAFEHEVDQYVVQTPEMFRGERVVFQAKQAQFFATKKYPELSADYKKEFADAVDAAQRDRLGASSMPTGTMTADEWEQAARRAAADTLQRRMAELNAMRGRGIFETFISFETTQFDQLIDNTLSLVRIAPATPTSGRSIPGQTVSGSLLSRDPDRLWRSDTVIGCIANMFIAGPRWLFTATAPMQNTDPTASKAHVYGMRALYLASVSLMVLFWFLMLALAGACITRLSALELAGIERAPLKDVFLFAIKRLWVFIKAPTVPFVILLVIGLAMTIFSLLGAIPYAGPIIIGLVFFAFLAVSFVLMLLLLGILGGFNLLYPAIAVEGADSFDAMSRSFAYVYARPWRLLFYSVISLVYGAITFIFVSFVVYVIFMLSHTFVGWGMNLFGHHMGAQSGVSALDTIWPEPRFMQLVIPANWSVMTWPEFIGSLLVHFWVYILVSGIGAYVISYYFSSHSIIYLLLRRSVDGQNLKEVYLEEK